MSAMVVVAAIIRRDAQILITRRFDHVHLPGLWEFPGGKVESGESLHVALEREIIEELGVRIHVADEFLSIEHEYPSKSIRLHFFNCTILEGEPQALDVAELRWVGPSDLIHYPFPPADAKVISMLRKSAFDKK
mgnify:CR=1 FL=1